MKDKIINDLERMREDYFLELADLKEKFDKKFFTIIEQLNASRFDDIVSTDNRKVTPSSDGWQPIDKPIKCKPVFMPHIQKVYSYCSICGYPLINGACPNSPCHYYYQYPSTKTPIRY